VCCAVPGVVAGSSPQCAAPRQLEHGRALGARDPPSAFWGCCGGFEPRLWLQLGKFPSSR